MSPPRIETAGITDQPPGPEQRWWHRWRARAGARPGERSIETPLCTVPERGLYMGLGALLFALLVGVAAAAAVQTQSNLLFFVVGLMVAALLVSPTLAARGLVGLAVERKMDDCATVGQKFIITYHIRNQRRFARALGVHLIELDEAARLGALTETFLAHLGAGQSTHLHVPVVPVRRGVVRFDQIRLACRFPFGLFTRFRTIRQPDELVIYPATGQLRAKTGRSVGPQVSEPASKAELGSDLEFHGLREFQVGDNPRRIHWKRSAHTGRLMVREMERYSPDRLVVVLDTYLSEPGEVAAEQRFEQAVSFAATLVCQSLEQGLQTVLVCTGHQPMVVPPQSGRPARRRFLRTLAAVTPQDRVDLNAALQALRWGQTWRGQCLAICPEAQSGAQAPVSRLREMIGPVRVITVGSAPWATIFKPPAAVEPVSRDQR